VASRDESDDPSTDISFQNRVEYLVELLRSLVSRFCG
jgi:hypothetical protein